MSSTTSGTARPRAVVTRRSFSMLGAALLGAASAQAGAPPQADTAPLPAALQADADLVQRASKALHPGLYRYNSPAQMRSHFDTLRRELAESMQQAHWQASAFLALTRLTAKIRCGHTCANFYNQSDAVQQQLFQGTNRLPCEFRWLSGRMVVTRDLRAEQCLPRGTAIMAIDWGSDARRVDARHFDLRSDGEPAGKVIIVPRDPRFAGGVFVLVGPANSSATFQFAQRIRAVGLGTWRAANAPWMRRANPISPVSRN